jgi:oligosaccharide repeat unit polymerase
MIVYIIAFGGVARLLSYAEYMRSFATSGTEFTSYIVSIMVIPARMITVTPIVVIPIIEKSRNKLLYKFIFVVSMILAVIFLLFNAGKAGIITFALCFIIPFLHKRIKHPWKITIIFGIVGVKILDLLDALFVYLQNGNWKITTNTIMESITGFTYPFRNLLFLPQMTEEFGFRWGRDFIIGPINIIPGVFFEPSYVITSKFFVGNNWKSIGGVPDDIITFGYLQLGLIGVIGVAVLFGIICGKIDRILSQIDSNSSYYFVATSIVISIFNYMASADITGLIRNQFQLYLCVFCVLYASSRRNYE